MDTKLTLKLDKEVIEKAKAYASSTNRSLSRLVETYLKSLVTTEIKEEDDTILISPFVKSLSSRTKIPSDLDYKKEYINHLDEKYK